MDSDPLKIFLQYILPKKTLTRLVGYLASIQFPPIKNYLVRAFIERYGVNMKEALEENPERYACFNDFFIRRLKPGCRPISAGKIVSPVDGMISEIGTIRAGQLLQAKGWHYTVQELLSCDASLSAPFNEGLFATLYLSPKDYHRVHMPLDGQLREMIYVPGRLFSVQPATVRAIPQLFARNERLVTLFDTAFGPMAMVLVGATIVGGIATQWHGSVVRGKKRLHFTYGPTEDATILLSKGDEMGYFKLGSTVVLLFTNSAQLKWVRSLQAGSRVRFGESLSAS